MTSAPYVNRNLLAKWRDQSRAIDHLHPLSLAIVDQKADASFKGYMAAPDGRVILRFVDDFEADEKFGARGATTEECRGLIFRLGNLKAIEDAALDAQKDATQLRKALSILTGYLSQGETPPQRAITDAAIVLRNTER